MGTTLRWGILGPGRIAPRLLRAVRASTRSEMVAVASRDGARAETFAASHGIARHYGSYEALLEARDLDVVYVALPNHLHAEWTIRALEAGKHVLCEKPLALSVDEVDAIRDASKRSGYVAVEAFMYLHHPQILRAIELAAEGTLGALQLIQGSFSFVLSFVGDARASREMGGGSLWDVGCYPVSLARRIYGTEPERVAAFARFDERGVDRMFVGLMAFTGGLLAQLDSGFAAVDRERIEIVGSEASLWLDAPFLPEPDGPPPSATVWRGRRSESVAVPSVDQYLCEVEDLTSVILDGTAPRVSLEFSRGTIETLVRLDAAARSATGAIGSATVGNEVST